MRNFIYLLLIGLYSFPSFGQVPAYYSSINLDLSGLALKEELSDLIIATHTSPTTYSEVWDVLKVADLDPTNDDYVLLIYGYDDSDGDNETDRRRDKNANGGTPPDEWNREHVFPKSLGTPDLGTTGPGSDPHHLRAADIDANGHRSNRKFASGSGNAGTVGSNWFPGEEWKGDVARMLMYMYLRYESRCKPSAVAVGSTNAIDSEMIDLLLTWNAEDEVSAFELNRNNAIYGFIGNRNPFIDNPALANRIWGGPIVEDTWNVLSIEDHLEKVDYFSIYPIPANNELIINSSTASPIQNIQIFSMDGQEIIHIRNVNEIAESIDISSLPTGCYLVSIMHASGIENQKIIVE